MEPSALEEDNTSMAARSLLTLNTSTSKGTQEETSKGTQDTSPGRPSQNTQIYVKSQNVSQGNQEKVIAVRIDRSNGNPNVQIMKSGQEVAEPSNKPQLNVEIMDLGQKIAGLSNKPQPNLQIMKPGQEVTVTSNRHKQQVFPSTEEGPSKPKLQIVDATETHCRTNEKEVRLSPIISSIRFIWTLLDSCLIGNNINFLICEKNRIKVSLERLNAEYSNSKNIWVYSISLFNVMMME